MYWLLTDCQSHLLAGRKTFKTRFLCAETSKTKAKQKFLLHSFDAFTIIIKFLLEKVMINV